MQITASKTDIFLGCQWPFDPSHEIAPRQVGEDGWYGSAFHKLLESPAVTPAEAAERWNVRKYVDELTEQRAAATKLLNHWMSGHNPFQVDFYSDSYIHHNEVSFATWIYPVTGRAQSRQCAGPTDEEHIYPDLATRKLESGKIISQEIGGTIDRLVTFKKGARGKKRLRVVMDYKTGEDFLEEFAFPDRLPQLRTLALPFTGDPVIAAVLHAPRRGLPAIYADYITEDVAAAHLEALRKAFDRVGDGSLRPGPWCKYCPARPVCPTRPDDAGLLARADKLMEGAHNEAAALLAPVVGLAANDSGGALQMEKLIRFMELGKFAKDLYERGRDEVKRLTKAGVPTGFEIQTRHVERMSKQDFIAAYGSRAAEKMFERFRKDGALNKKPEEWLIAEKG